MWLLKATPSSALDVLWIAGLLITEGERCGGHVEHNSAAAVINEICRGIGRWRAVGPSGEDAGRFANAVAARSVEHIGAVAGLQSYDEVRDWMKSARHREGALKEIVAGIRTP